ncbi:universal stress protein [Methylorubrum extorquens]|uniref:UspA domain protein n=1 Tax=Methylorubrum extorquens (strain CM4 / NCIMB 13688) TaxID=440085 RepID=B7KRR0_METC4|nr:universal stress protein [Methylorubrum extorquens]ACK85587.1 UspA domain protein [Methylorubrum extorquens CM4]
MAFASMIVPLDLGPRSFDRLHLACGLADRFDAHLIGVAAREALPRPIYGHGSYINQDAVDCAAARLDQELARVETEFRRVCGPRERVGWRAARLDPMTFLTQQARTADLVVLSRYLDEGIEDWCACIEPGEAILQLGRPVLIVPPGIKAVAARRIVVAWKDTREARRTLTDAMPFLKEADEVLLVEVTEEDDGSTRDVAMYLNRHGISCTPLRRSCSATGIAAQILGVARLEGADLVIAGAYGHSRMREMIFGSVTRSLLEQTSVCCLMSH